MANWHCKKIPSPTKTAAATATEEHCQKPPPPPNISNLVTEAMRQKAPANLFLILLYLSVLACFSLYYPPNAIAGFSPGSLTPRSKATGLISNAVKEAVAEEAGRPIRHVSSIRDGSDRVVNRGWIKTDSLLWPGWRVLLIVSPEEKLPPEEERKNYTCLYPNSEQPPARFAGVLPFTNRTAFACDLPDFYRHHHPVPKPILLRSPEKDSPGVKMLPPRWWSWNLPLWNRLAFEAIAGENDVVLFVKGLNRGLGASKSPELFTCVFGDVSGNGVVRTPVTSSVQEVFRCARPNITTTYENKPVKITLETSTEPRQVIPSVAYYTPWRRTLAEGREKSLLCATTMVYNVAKVLREWVTYHAKIGVEKFIIYDNESEDDLNDVVEKLNREGYNVETVLWLWPKTQEAGFSHAAVYANGSCTWMMYLDVDEFLFSPAWENSTEPSDAMLRSILPIGNEAIGQVSFKSNEFGPSNRTKHPSMGVTQGYTCRRREEQRHKSIVRLDAVDHSLYTAIHHFGLKKGYEWSVLSTDVAVVNHYKYQAWEEFKAKFRRRVSAYVVDWTRISNPNSRDRTPGLGFKPVEPEGWPQKFCEVEDERLKDLTRKWFGYPSAYGYRMAWQS